MIVIYHNPKCSTSCKVLELLRAQGIAPQVVEYLKTPLDEAAIRALLTRMGTSARQVLREKAKPYEELGLADEGYSEGELIAYMAQYPELINRPIVVSPKGAALCRPVEKVLELLYIPSNFILATGVSTA